MAHKKSKKHQYGRGTLGGVNLGLIITPFLDMAFQLLAFFIMTYHPPAFVGYVEGTLLPPSQVAVAKSKDGNPKDAPPKPKEPPPPAVDEEPQMADLLLVIVRTPKKGQKEGGARNEKGDFVGARVNGDPSFIEIRRPEQAGFRPLSGEPTLNDKEKFIKSLRQDLETELKKILAEPGSKLLKPDLKLEVDPDLKHKYWMQIYDTCKQAGYQNIFFVAPKLEQPVK